MKECYYVYYSLKFDDGKEYVFSSGFCYKENPQNVTVHFDTFDEMYDWIKDTGCDDIRVGLSLFYNQRIQDLLSKHEQGYGVINGGTV